jgi:hypothetical protein
VQISWVNAIITIVTTFGKNRTWPMRRFPNLPEMVLLAEIIGSAATGKGSDRATLRAIPLGKSLIEIQIETGHR